MKNLKESFELSPYEGPNTYAFISYCHEDEPEVCNILKLLKVKNARFWFDKAFGIGDDWKNIVKAKLLSIKCIYHIIFLTKNAQKSDAVKIECEISESNKDLKRIYIIFDEKMKNKVPKEYEDIIYADDSKMSPQTDFIDKIFRSLTPIIDFEIPFKDPIPIFKNKDLKEIQAIVNREFVHDFPYWHKTSNIITMWDDNQCLMKVFEPRKQNQPIKLSFWGGHSRVGEHKNPIQTAIRELTEEFNLPLFSIKNDDLIQIYEENVFICKLKNEDGKPYNYEKSTYYLYFIPDEIKPDIKTMEQHVSTGRSFDVSNKVFSLDAIQEHVYNPEKFPTDEKILFTDDVRRLFEIEHFKPKYTFENIIEKYMNPSI